MRKQLLSILVHVKAGAKQARPFCCAGRGVWLLASSGISHRSDPCFATALQTPGGFLFWGLVVVKCLVHLSSFELFWLQSSARLSSNALGDEEGLWVFNATLSFLLVPSHSRCLGGM